MSSESVARISQCFNRKIDTDPLRYPGEYSVYSGYCTGPDAASGRIDIGRRLPAFPVPPPCVRVTYTAVR